MLREKAQKQLNIGYLLIAIGLIIGVVLDKNDLNNGLSPFLFGYLFWSIYWGYKIAYTKISKHFSSFSNTPIHIIAKGTGDFLSKRIAYKFTIEFIKFWICYFIGALGGAIIQQVKLSRIAYFDLKNEK